MPLPLRPLIAAAGLLLAGVLPAQQVPPIAPDTRVRVLVRGEQEESRFVGKVERVDRETLRMIDEEAGELRSIPWERIQRLERSEGHRASTLADRAGIAAGLTAIGAIVGYSSWHSCNDPESDAIFSCIVMPTRLGTSVRAGTWVGLGVGFFAALAHRGSERWREVDVRRPREIVVRPAGGGVGVGVRFNF